MTAYRQFIICISVTILFLSAFSCIADNTARPGDAGAALRLSGMLKPGNINGTIEVDGRQRTFVIHLPTAFDVNKALPLVIVLHGGGGNAENAETMTGMSLKADTEGFIALYPNGSSRLRSDRFLTWNSGNCCGYAFDNNIDDALFIRKLIEALESLILIDPGRIYATGISNGGMMSYLLGCVMSDRIAAIAPVAGAMGMESCRPLLPVSVVIFHGTGDKHVLYEGGSPLVQSDNHARTDMPVSYAVDFWVKHNKCSVTPKKSESGNVRVDTYRGGQKGTEVVLYTIIDGKHAWHGGRAPWYGADEPTKEISATDIIWEFFKNHARHND